ncbi:hypothetical protein NMG60_11020261 [Bertholletia excelsa]
MIAQDSPNPIDLDEDQRKNASTEDSTAKTIESLRGQLSVERSVSKTARERADGLAKRVVELEEKLKIVSLQRKKAEMATADVLAILENHGVGELSDEFDLSSDCSDRSDHSDQEMINCESHVGNNSPEVESSGGCKTRRNHTDEFSSSELESSSLPGGSLSWKSGKDYSWSREKKYMDSSSRRRGSFSSSTSASPRHRTGKSCRQIRRRETRSAVEESQIDNSVLAPCENGVATSSEGHHICSDVKPEISRKSSQNQEEAFLERSVAGDLENQRSAAVDRNYLSRNDGDVERALEYQTRLIGQCEEEEKAQREWEEKFRENNSSTQDSCEHGNHSDVTEERDETRSEAPPPQYLGGFVASDDLESKSKVEDACVTKEPSKSQPGDFQAHPIVGFSQDQKSTSMPSHKSPISDLVYSVATGKLDQQYSGNYEVPVSHSCHQSTCLKGHDGNLSAKVFTSHAGDNSGSKNEHCALVPSETPDKFGPVLGALHQAKLSLKHKLSALPPRDSGSVGNAIEFSVGNRREVPVGCAALFRVPSDLHSGATIRPGILGSNPQLSLTNCYPDSGYSLSTIDHFVTEPNLLPRSIVPRFGIATNPCTLSSSSVPTGNKHLAVPPSPYLESRSKTVTQMHGPMETWPILSSHRSCVGPTFDTTLPSSSRYTINNPSIDRSLAPGTFQPFSSRYTFNDPSIDTSLSSGTYQPHPRGFAPNDASIDKSPASSSHSFPSYPICPDLLPRRASGEEPQRFLSSGYEMGPSNLFSPNRGSQPFSSSGYGMAPSNYLSPEDGPQHFLSSGYGMTPANNSSSKGGQQRFSSNESEFSFSDDHTKPNLYR